MFSAVCNVRPIQDFTGCLEAAWQWPQDQPFDGDGAERRLQLHRDDVIDGRLQLGQDLVGQIRVDLVALLDDISAGYGKEIIH